MSSRWTLFVGSAEVGRLVAELDLGERAAWLDENAILSFAVVHAVMTRTLEDVLRGRELPRGITGWYYQQFLKMQYAHVCEDACYLVWDGDTIPCGPFSMFHERRGQNGEPHPRRQKRF